MTVRRSAAERRFLLADGAYRTEIHLQPINTGYGCLTAADDAGTAYTQVYGLYPSNQGTIVKTLGPLTGLVYSNMAAYGSAAASRCRLYEIAGGIHHGTTPTIDNPATLYCFAQ